MDILNINRNNELTDRIVWDLRSRVTQEGEYIYCITNGKGVYVPIEIDDREVEGMGAPLFSNFKKRRMGCRFNSRTLTPRMYDTSIDTPSNFNRNVSVHLVSIDTWSYKISDIRYSGGAFMFTFDKSNSSRIDMVIGMVDNPLLSEDIIRPYIEVELYTMNVKAEKVLKTITIYLDNTNKNEVGVLKYDVKEEIINEEPVFKYIRNLIPGIITKNIICLEEDLKHIDYITRMKCSIHTINSRLDVRRQIRDIIFNIKQTHPSSVPSFFISRTLRRRSELKYSDSLKALNEIYYGFPIFKAYDRISVSIRDETLNRQ